jgi:hypothetical protein
VATLEREVEAGELSPTAAASRVLRGFAGDY